MMKYQFHQILLYEIGSRLFCNKNKCSLSEIPNLLQDDPVFQRADEIWLMGVWKNSQSSQKIARTLPLLRPEFQLAKENLNEIDIYGSPYSINDYVLDDLLGQKDELFNTKQKLNALNKKLILDFVPNHMSIDSIWVNKDPNLFLEANESTESQNQFIHSNGRSYCFGRDPYFNGWTDTIQWDFSNPKVEKIHIEILSEIAQRADGVRCDMAMLLLPDVFERTHRKDFKYSWSRVIKTIKSNFPNFKFYAEVYWNREAELLDLGFDATYDKSLYDSMVENRFESIYNELKNIGRNQRNTPQKIRFLENHDEKRSQLVFAERSKTYFSLLCFSESILLFHFGQSFGFSKKIPVQMISVDDETIDQELFEFYKRIFSTLKNRTGTIFIQQLDFTEFNSLNLLAFQITSNSQKEILIFNPNSIEVSGFLFLDEVVYTKEIYEVIEDNRYNQDPELQNKAQVYFKLAPGKSQWFIL